MGDTVNKRYDALLKNNPLMATIKLARYKFVAKILQSNDRALEIGCCDGVSTNFFSQYCKKIDGIDIDSQALMEARAEFPHISFREADVTQLSADKKYDTILMIDFIEHIEKEDAIILLEKCKTLLTDRGMIVIGTPSKHFELYRAEHNKSHHKHEYYPDELREMLDDHFARTMMFSMNDEVVHTGNEKLAWYIFTISSYPIK